MTKVSSTPEPAQMNLTREAVAEMLNQCRWNKAELVRRIGRSRTLVWKFMKK